MHKIYSITFLLIISASHAPAQQFMPIWPKNKQPNFNGRSVTDTVYNERTWRVGVPGIWMFPAARSINTGTAVLICPGGGYERLSQVYNGFVIAQWFNARGINAFVLKYRLPNQTDLSNRALAPLQDAQRAMRIIRSHGKEWNLLPGRIGLFGTSAGGHLVSTAGTHLTDVSAIKDSLDGIDYKADFMILLSPVISMGQFAHKGSRKNLLGDDPSKEMLSLYSNELQVVDQTPATFIVHALNDSTVPVKNSLLFYDALVEKNVNASLHVFPQGGHGIQMFDNPGSTDLFPELMLLWLKENKFLVAGKK